MAELVGLSDSEATAQLVKNAPELLALYDRHFALRPPTQEWERAALSCFARCQYSLRTTLQLTERPVDQVVLARAVYEFSLTMAWLCIDPTANFAMFLHSEGQHRKAALGDLRSFGVEGTDETVAILALAGAGDKPAPNVGQRAVLADAYWASIERRWPWHFRRSYANFYRYSSSYAHPLAGGLNCFLTKPPIGPFVLSDPDTEDGEIAAAGAVQAFADALVVSSHRFGWPQVENVTRAIATGFVKPEGRS